MVDGVVYYNGPMVFISNASIKDLQDSPELRDVLKAAIDRRDHRVNYLDRVLGLSYSDEPKAAQNG